MNEKAILTGMIVAVIFAGFLGHEIGYQSGYDNGRLECGSWKYDKGWSDGMDYGYSNIVLGLVRVPSGYYIINDNYGNFKVNTSDQSEAICKLRNEIDPCLNCKEI